MPHSAVARPTSVRLPSDIVLTHRSLAVIAARFSAAEIGELVEALIGHLDTLTGDVDREADPEMCRA